MTTITVRLIPAFFGIATIGLVFLLRRRLGTVATLAAALLLAVSPGAVYLSRYFIHETQFVFFTLGIVVAGFRFYDTRNPTYLLLASASAALLFATKETSIISMGVLLIAFGVTHGYRRFYRKRRSPRPARGTRRSQKGAVKRFIEEIGTANPRDLGRDRGVDLSIHQRPVLFVVLSKLSGCLRLAQHVRRLVQDRANRPRPSAASRMSNG